MERRPGRVRPDLRARFERLLVQLLEEEDVPAEDRFEGLILAMRAHGLPYDQKQVERIRKLWNECVGAQQRRRKRT